MGATFTADEKIINLNFAPHLARTNQIVSNVGMTSPSINRMTQFLVFVIASRPPVVAMRLYKPDSWQRTSPPRLTSISHLNYKSTNYA